MKIDRRQWLTGTGSGLLLGGLLPNLSKPALADQTDLPPRFPHTPVHTPNGWSLPYRLVDGVKEFHLVAEQFEHEFAPGSRATVWGYNGCTPGPTIEAIEGDRVRLLVSNRLPEHTSVHWHGLLLPNGMDGVSGLTQAPIAPGETWAYEFTLRQHGTHVSPTCRRNDSDGDGHDGLLHHPPARWRTRAHPSRLRRDAAQLGAASRHLATRSSVLSDFDLWTMNSKVFPAVQPLVATSGQRVRIRVANVSMWNHPIHLHGVQFEVTGSDGGRWPRNQWRREVTEIVGVGQCRDIEFVAVPGDWAFHCHMSHHTMNAMGHSIANSLGVQQQGLEQRLQRLLPDYMPMGEHGMAEHQNHTDSGHMPGPANTLPMMMGKGPFGNLEMGGMFNVVKVRDDLAPNDYRDPAGSHIRRARLRSVSAPAKTLANRLAAHRLPPERGKSCSLIMRSVVPR